MQRTDVRVEGTFSPRNYEQFPGYLELTLSTKVDLIASAVRSELNLWIRTDYCPMQETYEDRGDEITGLGPYYHDLHMPNSWDSSEQSKYQNSLTAETPESRRYEYQVLVVPSEVKRSSIYREILPSYDLAAPRADLCILIGGGNMLRAYFTSNVVVIPKAALIQALNDNP